MLDRRPEVTSVQDCWVFSTTTTSEALRVEAEDNPGIENLRYPVFAKMRTPLNLVLANHLSRLMSFQRTGNFKQRKYYIVIGAVISPPRLLLFLLLLCLLPVGRHYGDAFRSYNNRNNKNRNNNNNKMVHAGIIVPSTAAPCF
jgi:hypothetical protein